MRRACLLGTCVLALAMVQCSLLLDTGGLEGSPADAARAEATSAEPDATIIDTRVDASDGDRGGALPDGTVVWSANGHGYLVVARPGMIAWSAAKAEAEAVGGHLVTITSSDENTFVFDLVLRDDEVWSIEGRHVRGPWMGGFQVPGSSEPAGGWSWVTNEPFTFTAWGPYEPDNYVGDESCLHFWGESARAPTWNDDSGMNRGYVVEFE